MDGTDDNFENKHNAPEYIPTNNKVGKIVFLQKLFCYRIRGWYRRACEQGSVKRVLLNSCAHIFMRQLLIYKPKDGTPIHVQVLKRLQKKIARQSRQSQPEIFVWFKSVSACTRRGVRAFREELCKSFEKVNISG